MQIIREINCKLAQPSAVALGYFNGVHCGHRSVIHAAVAAAARLGAAPCVFTFDLPTDSVPLSKCGRPLLLSETQKFDALEQLGVQTVVTPHFEDFAAMPPEQFFSEVLLAGLGAKSLCCGEDYRFGAGAAGDTLLLRDLCRDAGIELIIVPPEYCGNVIISSTRIITALEAGEADLANRMLGREFTLTGTARCDTPAAPQSTCSCCAEKHPGSDDPEMQRQLREFFRNKAIAAFRTVYLDAPVRFARPACGIYRGVAQGKQAMIALYPCDDTLRWEAAFEDAGQTVDGQIALSLLALQKPMRAYDSPETLRAALFSMSWKPPVL